MGHWGLSVRVSQTVTLGCSAGGPGLLLGMTSWVSVVTGCGSFLGVLECSEAEEMEWDFLSPVVACPDVRAWTPR